MRGAPLDTGGRSIADLLDSARRAGGLDRISFRDPLASFGLAAITPVAGTLGDPVLGAFALRVLEKIAVAHPEAVDGALRAGLPRVSSQAVRADVQRLIEKLASPIEIKRTLRWMATQPRGGGGQWTLEDAERLVDKMRRAEDRREAEGQPRLTEVGRSEALSLQFRGFNSRPYRNHCWKCRADIDSDRNARCDRCTMFFCDECGTCMCRRP